MIQLFWQQSKGKFHIYSICYSISGNIYELYRPDYISPLDDLAFAMYQDPEISQIIRDLDKKKSDCVIGIIIIMIMKLLYEF